MALVAVSGVHVEPDGALVQQPGYGRASPMDIGAVLDAARPALTAGSPMNTWTGTITLSGARPGPARASPLWTTITSASAGIEFTGAVLDRHGRSPELLAQLAGEHDAAAHAGVAGDDDLLDGASVDRRHGCYASEVAVRCAPAGAGPRPGGPAGATTSASGATTAPRHSPDDQSRAAPTRREADAGRDSYAEQDADVAAAWRHGHVGEDAAG
jgi:hypothetical protein